MSKRNDTSLFDESRIYEENGEVKVRRINHESPVTDLTPHPTETRVFIKDGEVVEILSKEIQSKGKMSLEYGRALLKANVRKIRMLS